MFKNDILKPSLVRAFMNWIIGLALCFIGGTVFGYAALHIFEAGVIEIVNVCLTKATGLRLKL